MGPSQAILSVGEADPPPKIEVQKKEKHGVKDGARYQFSQRIITKTHPRHSYIIAGHL